MKRVLTAAWLVPFGTYSIFFAPEPLFVATVCLLAAFCFREYARMGEKLGWQGMALPGYVLGVALLALPQAGWAALALLPLVAMGMSLKSEDAATGVASAAGFSLGVLYVFGAWKCGIALHEKSAHWLFFAAALNWAGDVAAYYTGRSLGKHKLAPRVSPNKTVEGSLGGLVASVVFGCVYLPRMGVGVGVMEAGGLALVGAVAGQVGDLCESALKRAAGMKDSGTMLAGHGGWLDRLDSSLFSMPAVYWALLLIAP